MPSVKIVAPTSTLIYRFRCYVCGEPWWEEAKTIAPYILDAHRVGHNTIFALCDPCSDRFMKEGLFWRKHGQEQKQAEE